MKPLFIFSFLFVAILGCKKQQQNGDGDNGIPAVSYLNTSYGTSTEQTMDVYLPANRDVNTTKVMMVIHGGAWAAGDKSDMVNFIDTIKKRLPDYAIFNLNYRLAFYPNTFPAQEEDTKAAIEFIYNNRNTYGISDKFVLLGASAGAHLSLLHAYKYNSPVAIKAVVDFFGPTDMVALYNSQTTLATVVGGTPTTKPLVYYQSSPINYVTNASCPTIILQGDNDPLVNYQLQSETLKNKLQLANVPYQYILYPGKGHGVDWDGITYANAFSNIQNFLQTYNP
jgi:acetyl esterase/lipase